MGRRSESEIKCEDVPALVETFVSTGLDRAVTAGLRAHTGGCPECRDLYREAVRTAAHIGHAHRTERVDTERAVRRWNLWRDVISAHATPRGRAARLRTLLYPAFFCYLIVQFAGGGPKERVLEVEVLEGTVHAGPSLGRGEICATGSDGRACLQTEDGLARLEPDTRLLVERVSPPRLRLLTGRIELEGSWQVATTLGVVEVTEGLATMNLDGGGLECVGVRGDVLLIDSRGERSLTPGRTTAILAPSAH